MRTLLCAALAALALGAACSSGPDNSGYRPPRVVVPTATSPANMPPPPVAGAPVTLPSGLQYIEIQPGNGPSPTTGQTVRVHYSGWLTATGQKFDSSVDRGQPFSFVLGTGQVIKGWDEGVALMKVGEKRRLIIPPDLAYGAQARDRIPANSSLTFDVELLAIEG